MIPLFKYDDDGIPFVNGTGTLLEYNGKKFIATAFHVLKKKSDISRDSDGDIYILSDTMGMVRISAWGPNFIPPNDFEKKIDVATINLGERLVSLFPADSFYQVKGYLDELDHLSIGVCVMGFPATAHKYDRVRRKFQNTPHLYTGGLKTDEEIEKIGYKNKANVGIHFNVKKTMSRGQKDIRATDPNGISGGPMWIIFDSKNKGLDAVTPVLIGIATTYSSYHKTIIGTHVNVLLMQKDKIAISKGNLGDTAV
jgi:hypothetical protein